MGFGFGWHAALEVHDGPVDVEAGGVDGRLGVLAEVQHVHQHLHDGRTQAGAARAAQSDESLGGRTRSPEGRAHEASSRPQATVGAIMEVSRSPGASAKNPPGFRSSSPIMLFM